MKWAHYQKRAEAYDTVLAYYLYHYCRRKHKITKKGKVKQILRKKEKKKEQREIKFPDKIPDMNKLREGVVCM